MNTKIEEERTIINEAYNRWLMAYAELNADSFSKRPNDILLETARMVSKEAVESIEPENRLKQTFCGALLITIQKNK